MSLRVWFYIMIFLEAIFHKARHLEHCGAVFWGQVQRSGHPTDIGVAKWSRQVHKTTSMSDI